MAEFRRGSFPQPYGKKEWYGGLNSSPFVQVIDVSNNLKLVPQTKQTISKLAQEKSVFAPQGTVVVTLQGSIGRVAITQYDSYIDRTLLIFERFLLDIDKYFWAYVIQKKFAIESKLAPGGTIKTITKDTLANFQVLLPDLKEQIPISIFFKYLDKMITLHQRKLNSLQSIKKQYLDLLFI